MEPWSANLAGGDEELDDAHELLYEVSTAIEDAVAREDLHTARWKLDEFFDLTAAHFAAEERWMRESAYPKAAAHLADHADYLSELQKLRQEIAARGLSPLFKLWFGSRFTGWLRSHVRGMDLQFARHLRPWREAQAAAASAPVAGGDPPAGGAPPGPAGS